MNQPLQDALTGHHYIHGAWKAGEGRAFCSTNPADGTLIWQGHHATEGEIEQAMSAAHDACMSWKNKPLAQRIAVLQGFANQVSARHEALSELISRENGKPLWEARTEVNSVVAKIQLSIQAYQERCLEKHQDSEHLRYKPLGVVAVLGPFNFPAHLSNGHIIPALLAGNTVVLKPSEQTPAVAEFIMRCWQETAIPPGVINCIQGDGHVASTLLNHPLQAVYFTGSYQTGQRIHQQFAGRPEILLALEMGGNTPLVIDAVANKQSAIYQTLLSCFLTSGQRCTSARRIFIPDTAWGNQFLTDFIQVTDRLTIGRYDEKPEPFMGPVISALQAEAHLQAQNRLLELGATPLSSMRLLKPQTGFLSAGILDMTGVSTIFDEEIFAPLVQIYRYRQFDRAISMANHSRYGLAAGLISDNPAHYEQFYQQINAGLINWNRPTTGASSSLPFGGIGISGNHRPSAYFAADYCAYPIASQEQNHLAQVEPLLPGINLKAIQS